jgi:peroxiredoxin
MLCVPGYIPYVRALALIALLAACDQGTASSSNAAVASAPAKERVAVGPDADKIDATTIVGKPVPSWGVQWLDGAQRATADLRGSVVLVRWFTEGCPYCAETAPSLVALDRELARRGLRVIGIYHHKSDEPLDVSRVRAFSKELGFTFPVAIDHDWRTLRQWWLDQHPGWTSISFLIDRRGIVRYVHTGGSYAPGSSDAAQMRRWIDQLLAEPAS